MKSGNHTDFDIVCIERAIELAGKGSGLNHPNPLVGSVVAKDGKIHGEGFHLYKTVEHAEPIAIRNAGEHAKNATLYVNLEPCIHHGRTPPCVDAIINAGIARVVFSLCDPDERVCERGMEILLNAGVKVDRGLLANKAFELNRDYLKAKTTGLPWTVVKVATSLDGRIGIPNVKGEYFSSKESLEIVHLMRGWADAIMVGASTVRLDNPKLTSRIKNLDESIAKISDEILYPKPATVRNPVRVTISNNPDFDEDSNILDVSLARTIIIVPSSISSGKTESLESKGVEIIKAECDEGGIVLEDALRKLCSKGIMSLMVEGGGKLIGQLIENHLVDEIYIAMSPILIGGKDSPSWLERRLAESISDTPRLRNTCGFKAGDDCIIRSRFTD